MDNDGLVFWVAYQEQGEKKHYLGDGKGHVRLFKSKAAIEAFLESALTPVELASTIIHSVTGQIVVPEPEPQAPPLISTLIVDFPPTIHEQLTELLKRKGLT